MPENHTAEHHPDVVYPHQIRDDVTTAHLEEHFNAHPEAYHPGLHQDVQRLIGATAIDDENDEPWHQTDYDDLADDTFDGHVMAFDDEDYVRSEYVNGDVSDVLDMLGNPDRRLGADEARTLIENDRTQFLANNIDRFDHLSPDVAFKLIEVDRADAAQLVLDNIEKFGMDRAALNELADVLSTNEPETLMDSLFVFSDLSPDIITNLMEYYDEEDGLVNTIAHYAHVFREFPPKMAERFVEKFDIGEVIESGDKLGIRCDDQLLRRILHRVDDGREVGYPDDEELPRRVADKLYKFEDLNESTLARLSLELGYTVREYPRHASEQIRDRWFGEMSYTRLEGGWNAASMGRIIRLRIEQGLEQNIHDASQWLSAFSVPEHAYDVADILQQRQQATFDTEAIGQKLLYHTETEEIFLSSIVEADPALRKRLNLSIKPDRIRRMFFAPAHRLVYEALVSEVDGIPLYKRDDFDLDALEAQAESMVRDFAIEANKRASEDMSYRLENEAIWSGMHEVITTCREYPVLEPKISECQQQLLGMGRDREQYIDDAKRWLTRHATSPSSRLTKVWQDRAMILMSAERVSDNARDLAQWQNEKGLELVIQKEEESGRLAEMGFSAEEIMSEKWAPWRNEILRVKGAEDFLEIAENIQRWRAEREWQEKILPVGKEEVLLEGSENTKSLAFQLEILDKEDPRGYTIGEDTGCCMTLHGESASCIKAGYEREDAGFLAVYAPDNRLAAQSFWYIHPDHADTIVLDNIEANQGRDFKKLTSVYAKGLESYLTKYNATHPDAPIKKVHVGTGFTDVNISHLAHVEAIPPLNSTIYTDAYQQKLLLSLA